jgi:hypothetical protein
LQHRINALDLQPSVAVGMPSGSKNCCSPRAMETSLHAIHNQHSVASWLRGNQGCFLPSLYNQPIFPRDQFASHDALASGCETPSARPKRLVQDASVFDLGKVQDAIGLDFDVVLGNGGEQRFRLLGRERDAAKAMV